MKRLYAIVIGIFLCVQLGAQSESCMAVVNVLTQNKDIWDGQTGIDYVLANREAFDKENEADMWLYNLALGARYYPLGKYAEALPYLRNVTSVIDAYGGEIGIADNPQLLETYYWEANCEYHTNAPKDIFVAKLQRAKAIYEKYNLTDTEIYKGIISDIDVLQSEIIDVLAVLQTAIEYVVSNKHQDAISLFEQVINKWPVSRPREELFPCFQALGNSYIAVGRLKDAENIYLNALTELDGKQEIETYRNICDALGVLYCQVHNYQKAKDFSGLSKQLHEKYMDFDESYIRCLSNCALAESGMGNLFTAKLFIDVAIKYMRKGTGYRASKDLVNRISKISTIAGNEIDAKTFSEQADRMLQLRPYIQLLSNASMIYQHAGFLDDAITCIKECIAMNEELGEENALIYNNLATLYLAQARINESLPYFEKAISLCQTDYEKNEILFNYALALWLVQSKECTDAAVQASKMLTNSIASNFSFLSQEERNNLYKHFEYYLPFLNLMFYESGDESQFGNVFNNILTAKGLLLRVTNGVKEAIMNSGNKQDIDDYNRLVLLRQQYTSERDSLQRINIAKEIEQLDKRLSRNAAEYGAFVKSNNTKWQDVCTSLREDDIAIEFYNIPIIYRSDTVQNLTGEPRYCAVFLKKGFKNPKIIPLCRESEIEGLESDSLYNTDLIYQLIWQPLERELASVKNIYFAADRELHQIGVEYALLPDNSRIDDKYRLHRLSSTRLLAEKRSEEKSKDAVLFGGLKYDLGREQLITESRKSEYHATKTSRTADMDNLRYGVKYLPGTKKEVETIAQNFALSRAKCEIITDASGTEEAFRALENKHIDIIHLATHGFFWSEEDADKRNYVSFLANMNEQKNYEDAALLRSGLFFSGANIGLAGESLPDDVEDGILTAQELSAMNLGKVDMVVMSACQSGLGEVSGEGVFGLQRGFKLAGANTLLMSLWKVDDEATLQLMTAFYKNYLKGMSKRESLLKAQKTLRETPGFEDPYNWAAFILLDGLN